MQASNLPGMREREEADQGSPPEAVTEPNLKGSMSARQEEAERAQPGTGTGCGEGKATCAV